MHRLTNTWWGRNMVCSRADQFAENFLESSGIDVKRSKLEGRSGILMWKWTLEYLDHLWLHVQMKRCRQRRHGEKFPTVPPPAPPPEEHVPEIRGHSISGGGDVAAKMKMVICGSSYADPTKTKVMDRVVRSINILGAPVSYLPNEDGKLIDTGQISIAQILLECKNDIYVMMVSWWRCVTSKEGYTLILCPSQRHLENSGRRSRNWS